MRKNYLEPEVILVNVASDDIMTISPNDDILDDIWDTLPDGLPTVE